MRNVAAVIGLAVIAALAWAGWHYHETGRWPFEPRGEFSVSERTFDRILAQLAATPSVPPKFAPPALIPAATEAAGKCGLMRQAVTWTKSVLDKEKTASAAAPTYALETTEGAILTSPDAVFATADTFAVNVDGSPRAYHPGDVYGKCDIAQTGPDKGKKVCAINFLCYAGVRIFQGAREIKCGARDAYKKAWNDIWGEVVGGKAKEIPRSYWQRGREDFSSRYGFFHPKEPLTVMFKDTIIRKDAAGRPCQRDVPGTRYEGYFVAATSLTGDEGADEREGKDRAKIVSDSRCDPIPYVDAEKLANIVIPVGGFAGASVGDLVVAYRNSGGSERWVYAVVGDQGPNHKFGEGSVAFNAAIKGTKTEWANYSEIVRNLHISPRNKDAGPVGTLIFKGTRPALAGDLSTANVEKQALEAFLKWGNGDVTRAKERFRACMTVMK
ncbi:MAG: hypothetical protein RLZ98_1527 [Pseudomonadota bacterium]|jgi:hypothetical protein